jgi:hypothetical protein
MAGQICTKGSVGRGAAALTGKCFDHLKISVLPLDSAINGQELKIFFLSL